MTRPPPWLDPRTAYVHIPFCAHHCGYCDFAIAAGQDHLIELYVDALALELATLGRPRPVESLFIGGGTPTHLSAAQLGRLLAALETWLPLVRAPGAADAPEYSIESTPDSLDDEKVAVLAAFGVNRVSLGVQSFQAAHLSALDRRHTADDVPRVIDLVRRRIPAVSLDLIFGAPGSTLGSWREDLRRVVAMGVVHLSTYGLTYEKGTPLWKQWRRGQATQVGEEAELAMYEAAIDDLGAAGYEHYEISNFARPGWRCLHNERYWMNEAYYGFGVGAARYVDGQRDLNIRDTKLYVRRVLAGESPLFQTERLGPRDRAFETIGTQLRRAAGVDRARFAGQTGLDLDALVGPTLRHLAAEGIVADDGAAVRLTRRGKCIADGVIEELMKNNVPGAGE